MSELSDAAREAQREYFREWRRKHPDRVREIKRRYWEKKAAQMQEQRAHGDVPDIRVGKWIAEPNCWYRCSACGSHYPCIKGYMDYLYCPTCGTRMGEVE